MNREVQNVADDARRQSYESRMEQQASMTMEPADAGTSFADLPADLQSLLFAYSAAPLRTCKAAAAVGKRQDLIATWLLNSGSQWPLFTTAQCRHWGACLIILDSQRRHRPPDLARTLHAAVAKGSLELVSKLMQWGAWADWAWSKDEGHSPDTDRMSDSQLQEHAYLNQQEVWIIKFLRHPLLEAAAHGRLDICSLFLSEKQFPSLLLHQALCAAAAAGHLAVVELLYTTDPAVNTPNLGSDNVLCKAALSGNLQLVQFLIDNGADVNNTPGTPWSKQGLTSYRANGRSSPVVAAACVRNPAVLQLLVDRGAALESCWHEALTDAAFFGKLEPARLLLQLADTALSSSPWQGQDTFDVTQSWYQNTWQEQGFYMWERFWSPLHGAAFSKHRDIVQLLLECGHDCGCKGAALMSAVGNGDVPMMRMLIAHGADVNGEYSGEGRHRRPVEEAIQRGSLEALQLFVQSGANIQDSDLVAAARSGKEVGVLRFLLDLGLKSRDDAALMAAAASYHQSWPVLQLLLESGAGPEGSSADAQQHTSLGTRLGKALVAAAGAGRLRTMEQLLNYHVHLGSCASGGTDSSSGSTDISKTDLTQALHLLDENKAKEGVLSDQPWPCDYDAMLQLVQRIGHVRELLIRHGADTCAN
jgi:hypothetical protein